MGKWKKTRIYWIEHFCVPGLGGRCLHLSSAILECVLSRFNVVNVMVLRARAIKRYRNGPVEWDRGALIRGLMEWSFFCPSLPCRGHSASPLDSRDPGLSEHPITQAWDLTS